MSLWKALSLVRPEISSPSTSGAQNHERLLFYSQFPYKELSFRALMAISQSFLLPRDSKGQSTCQSFILYSSCLHLFTKSSSVSQDSHWKPTFLIFNIIQNCIPELQYYVENLDFFFLRQQLFNKYMQRYQFYCWNHIVVQ